MSTVEWSTNLPDLITSLRQLTSKELLTRLANPALSKEWNISHNEKHALMKALSKKQAPLKVDGDSSVQQFWL